LILIVAATLLPIQITKVLVFIDLPATGTISVKENALSALPFHTSRPAAKREVA
jgi:hypothetical protein